MRPDSISKFSTLQILLSGLIAFATLSSDVLAADESKSSNATEQSQPTFTNQLRWGRMDPKSDTAEVVQSLNELFLQDSQKLNFAKRDLTSLLEQSMPRKLGSLFPFRRAHKIPPQLFFENFGRRGFLVGEIDPRVPPILSGTETADWLELRSFEPVPTAREFATPLPLNQGLRGLGTQNPWSTEIFSAGWTQPFETASSIVEYGGLKCWNKSLANKQFPTLAEPATHVRCSVPLKELSQESAIPRQLPRKVGSAAAASAAASNAPSTPPACLPMGRLQTQSLELLGDEKAGHCLLWRQSLDERFIQKGSSSKLVCLNARHKSFQRTRFNSVVAVLPTSRPDAIHILESEDGLLMAHRLSLATLSVSKEEVTVPSGQNLRSAAFPLHMTGLYACQQPGTPTKTLFPNADNTSANLDWVYVDDVIYSGLRPVRSETDVAWRIKESADGSLDVERLSWSQLQYDHPSISNDRPFACVSAREIDAKCGLRVLQTAMQLSEEWLNGDFDKNGVSPAVQLSASLIVAQSLERVARALPNWSLRPETEELLSVYSQKIRQLSENKALARSGITFATPAKKLPASQRFLDLPSNSQDFNAIKKLLSSSVDFWAVLKQKSL